MSNSRVDTIIFYVGLHRYLYNTQEWSWGGPKNSNRSFVVELPLKAPIGDCEPQLCGALIITNPNIKTSLKTRIAYTYCGGAMNFGAICKKRLLLSSPSESATQINTVREPSGRFLSILLGLSSLSIIFIAVLLLVLMRLCLARARVCHPQQRNETSGINNASECLDATNTTSYGQMLCNGYSAVTFGITAESVQKGMKLETDQQTQDSGCIERDHHKIHSDVDNAYELCRERTANCDANQAERIESYELRFKIEYVILCTSM